MPTIIDNLELDEMNVEFNNAIDIVNHTNKIIYLTGKAGTGKTTFLKYLRSITDKKTIIVAPTGVAAINAGGQTINSFFQIPFGPFIPNDKRLRTSKSIGDIDDITIYSTFRYREDKRIIIENLELLIIDEISMVRCDQLDVIDRILKVFRKKTFLPFGGVQIVLIGDTFQLPPIANFEQWEILKEHYQSPFFFNSRAYSENKPFNIELKKIYRQKEQEFIDLLNKVRVNQLNDDDLKTLNSKYDPTFSISNIQNYIILSTHNVQVDRTNSTKLDELTGELKIFKGELTGTFPTDSRGNIILPTEQNLHLKENAQVMFLKNDINDSKRYYNGKIGKISSLSENKIIVEFSDQTTVQVEKVSWNNIQYTWNKEKQSIEEKTIGTFSQYPLRLAWAITVHKSQGLTFEKVYADLGAAFEDGQIYVALSRCTSFNGLILKSIIPKQAIKTNQKVIEFAKSETPNTLIIDELNSGKADFYYNQSRKYIKNGDFESAYINLIKAIKFRNDIETETFKRYIAITASRLISFRNYFEKQIKEIKHVNDVNKALEIMSKAFIDDNAELKKSNEASQAKIKEQNNAIKLVIDQNKIYESEN